MRGCLVFQPLEVGERVVMVTTIAAGAARSRSGQAQGREGPPKAAKVAVAAVVVVVIIMMIIIHPSINHQAAERLACLPDSRRVAPACTERASLVQESEWRRSEREREMVG